MKWDNLRWSHSVDREVHLNFGGWGGGGGGGVCCPYGQHVFAENFKIKYLKLFWSEHQGITDNMQLIHVIIRLLMQI